MADALGDLTEKEKEALRLLLSGHDAKSSARELDISVHTINDRLRNARRKLDVSSSREAARILGDAEDATPQNHARNDLGSANGDIGRDPSFHAISESSGSSGSDWRMKGLVIMTCTIAIAALAVAITNAGLDTTPETTHSEDNLAEASDFEASPPIQRAESEEAAREWLALLGAGDAQAARERAAENSELLRPSDDWWELGVALHRNNHGVLIRRELLTVEQIPAPQGSGADAAELLTFYVDYQKTPNAIEQLAMYRVDGEWRPANYDLEAPEEDGCE
ncbi:helix-turn-helix domain-containing protein [Aurantiacibacter sp. MUD61]|uniref:helix-turn-helix domain-containing protein n=1 Tax=Aurantiacibacter sp. MUD61 TaxID=3009083 RepID=UPI0022EFF8D2|nr:LuxR C-terminal-related transcriptional regulator [Aurantiacibacter sp. MUD61]